MTFYEKEACPTSGEWSSWAECRTKQECGNDYGYWFRKRVVCQGDDDEFIEKENPVCAHGFTGLDCSECASEYIPDAKTGDCKACPEGWFYHQNTCYKIFGIQKTFEEAVETCQSETLIDAKLFEPTSEAQNKAIFDVVYSIYGEYSQYFVGIKIDGESGNNAT